jgi:hypothetical protein
VALTFANGVRVTGDLSGDRLTLAAHRTAKGREIPEKSWVIATAPPEPDGRVSFRVVARA